MGFVIHSSKRLVQNAINDCPIKSLDHLKLLVFKILKRNNLYVCIVWCRWMLRKNLSKLYLIVPYFLLAFGSLTLRVLIPPNIIYNSPHDDLLGVKIAQDILNGSWLGSWDNRTLLKPPGYSYFLVLCHYLHITPHVALHILYILASLYFIYVISLILKSRFSAFLTVCIFAFLIFNIEYKNKNLEWRIWYENKL